MSGLTFFCEPKDKMTRREKTINHLSLFSLSLSTKRAKRWDHHKQHAKCGPPSLTHELKSIHLDSGQRGVLPHLSHLNGV